MSIETCPHCAKQRELLKEALKIMQLATFLHDAKLITDYWMHDRIQAFIAAASVDMVKEPHRATVTGH